MGPNLGQNRPIQVQNKFFFCHFRKFGSLILLKTAEDDSLEQCLTFGRGKSCQKIWGEVHFGQTSQNWVQS